MAILTIRGIKHAWQNSQFNNFESSAFLKAILPDIYNDRLTPSNIYYASQQTLCLSQDQLNKFLNGNRRPKNNEEYYYAAATLTQDIKKWLLSKDKIIYKENVENVSEITAKESMLQNIYRYVRDENPKLDKEHKLFNEIELSQETLYDEELVKGIKKLLDCGSERCLSYAIFLMFLVSIFQNNIVELNCFYKENIILQEIKNDKVEKKSPSFISLDINSPAYTYFVDEKYMHEYHVYAFKPTYDQLYQSGKLSMKLMEHNIADATLILQDQINALSASSKILEKKYVGTPILSVIDEVVYIIFTNANGLFALLCFKYDRFNFAEMYYRTGLLITSYPKMRVPQVQKIAISMRELSEKEKSYIEGILKMSSEKIVITEKQLSSFLKEFSDEHWMDDFKKTFLPFIEMHKCSCYTFSENELLSYTLSEMNKEDRIRVIEAIKSKSEHPNIIDCREPEKLHKVILNGFSS